MLQEYNPQGIHQAIRLPGQHHDREAGAVLQPASVLRSCGGELYQSGSDWVGRWGKLVKYPFNPNADIDSFDLYGLEIFLKMQRKCGK